MLGFIGVVYDIRVIGLYGQGFYVIKIISVSMDGGFIGVIC
jgi:hypothetical protein